jgi:hypothetical protein
VLGEREATAAVWTDAATIGHAGAVMAAARGSHINIGVTEQDLALTQPGRQTR